MAARQGRHGIPVEPVTACQGLRWRWCRRYRRLGGYEMLVLARSVGLLGLLGFGWWARRRLSRMTGPLGFDRRARHLGTEVTAPALRAALDDVAELGPFFAASANPAEVVDGAWRPLRELYTDPEPLADRIRRVADALGTGDRRVAGSIAFQGLAARLVSPVLAVASVHRLVPSWSPASLHWRPAVHGPWPLWESGTDALATRPEQDGLPASVAGVLVEPHLAALAAATRAAVSVSALTLWGNAASALAAAGRLVAQARPEAEATAARIVDGVLAAGPLAGSGGFERPWIFRRRSCCLYYRVPGGRTCGDCVLAETEASQPPSGG